MRKFFLIALSVFIFCVSSCEDFLDSTSVYVYCNYKSDSNSIYTNNENRNFEIMIDGVKLEDGKNIKLKAMPYAYLKVRVIEQTENSLKRLYYTPRVLDNSTEYQTDVQESARIGLTHDFDLLVPSYDIEIFASQSDKS